MEERCRELLAELGIAGADEFVSAKPLTGGVASDIALVELRDRRLCVKFALPKLKVEADWFAPVHRNAAEYAWLDEAARIAPESTVQMFGRSERLHGFAMEFIDGEGIYLWKTALLEQAPDLGEAAKVGDLIGRIHGATGNPDLDRTAFQNRDDFHSLRIEPYITYTAGSHADLADELHDIADELYANGPVLIHGDVSPKNILLRAGKPIILDAECATMGDPGFDPAFCLNHLVLKAIHLPGATERYLRGAIELWQAYAPYIGWEPAEEVEKRVRRLLPALMLARVDGKSPVEYLDEENRERVRRIARDLLKNPREGVPATITAIAAAARE